MKYMILSIFLVIVGNFYANTPPDNFYSYESLATEQSKAENAYTKTSQDAKTFAATLATTAINSLEKYNVATEKLLNLFNATIEKQSGKSEQTTLIAPMADLFEQIKLWTSVTHKESEYIMQNWYPLITQTTLISNNQLKKELAQKIGSTQVVQTEPLVLWSTTHEKLFQASLATPAQEKSPVKKFPTQKGIQGLHELISSPKPIKEKSDNQENEKQLAASRIKKFEQQLQELHQTFNDATQKLVRALAALEPFDLETQPSLKPLYTLLNDADFAQAPDRVKFDTYKTGLQKLWTIALERHSQQLSLVKSFVQFIQEVQTDAQDKHIPVLQKHYIRLKRLASDLQEQMTSLLSLITQAKPSAAIIQQAPATTKSVTPAPQPMKYY